MQILKISSDWPWTDAFLLAMDRRASLDDRSQAAAPRWEHPGTSRGCGVIRAGPMSGL